MSTRVSVARAEKIERVVTVVTVIAPLVAVAIAAVIGWLQGVPAACFVVCAAMYLITTAGITMGYHRLFTHHSYQCKPVVRFALGVAGSMASQGPLFFWVASHRRHHQHSDDEGDPHSPHTHGDEGAGVLLGWWHAHAGWMFTHKPENYFRLVNDLVRDPLTNRVHRYYFAWVLLGLVLPGVIVGVIEGNWTAFWLGVLWGGLVRMFLVHHMTWSVNSVCHLFGSKPFDTGDESRNNAVIALISLGEGWHNNHHAFPSSARHGLSFWQFDPSYLALLALKSCGLVWNVRLPATTAAFHANQFTHPTPDQAGNLEL